MNEDDFRRRLAFVSPERRLTVERRLHALRIYDALEHPTPVDAMVAADELGVTRAGFEWILKAWRAKRDPTALEGVSGGTTAARAVRGDERFIRGAFAALPAGRPLEQDAADIRRQATESGVSIRGVGSLRRMLTLLRAERDAACAATRIVVDHVVLEMPVEVDDGDAPVMPVASVVADVQAGALLSVTLDLYMPNAASIAKALARAAARGAFVAADGPTTIGFDVGADDSWTRITRALASNGVRVVPGRSNGIRGGGHAGDLIVPALLGIGSRPGIVNKHVDLRRARLRKRGDAALPLHRAQEIIDERLSFEPRRPQVSFSDDPAALTRLQG